MNERRHSDPGCPQGWGKKTDRNGNVKKGSQFSFIGDHGFLHIHVEFEVTMRYPKSNDHQAIRAKDQSGLRESFHIYQSQE